jgi:hypothetical protein
MASRDMGAAQQAPIFAFSSRLLPEARGNETEQSICCRYPIKLVRLLGRDGDGYGLIEDAVRHLKAKASQTLTSTRTTT